MKVFTILPKAAVLAIAAIIFLTVGPSVARAVTHNIFSTQQRSTVSEPAALFLLGIGLTGAAGIARRKHRRNSASLR